MAKEEGEGEGHGKGEVEGGENERGEQEDMGGQARMKEKDARKAWRKKVKMKL